MMIVPLQATPSQTLQVTLGSQLVQLNLAQKMTGLFIDIYVANNVILTGAICQNLNWIVRDSYLGFIGDLFFFDTQGVNDPAYSGLGTRYLLAYVSPKASS
jgi:hypothetical protein